MIKVTIKCFKKFVMKVRLCPRSEWWQTGALKCKWKTRCKVMMQSKRNSSSENQANAKKVADQFLDAMIEVKRKCWNDFLELKELY